MAEIIFIICILLPSAVYSAGYSNIPGLDNRVYEKVGDINIGGLFPLHQPGIGKKFCGPLRELGVLQRAEAMAFFIDEINRDPRILPNVTLGYKILDGCYKETTALAQSLRFVPNINGSIQDDVVAVIGAESSSNSKQVAELLGLYHIPQVSYLSTSEALSDKIAFPYFTRIVPSDTYQVAAIVSLLKHFEWTFISFIYSFSIYGQSAYYEFLSKLRMSGNQMCIAYDYPLQSKATRSEREVIIRGLLDRQHGNAAHAVVLYMPQVEASTLLKVAMDLNATGHFTWIASDAWGRNIQDFDGIENIGQGALTIKINSTNDADFDKHFSKLNPSTSINPFMEEFWINACTASSINCDENSTFGKLSDIYRPEMTITLVKVAVQLIAQQLDMLMRECRSQRGEDLCIGSKARNYVTGQLLQSRMRSISGCVNTTCVSVDENGEGKSQYSIQNMQKIGGHYQLNRVGSYDTMLQVNQLNIDNDKIQWNSRIPESRFSRNRFPTSICSEQCDLGEKQVRSVSFTASRCCWSCQKCNKNEITTRVLVDGLYTTLCKECKPAANLSTTLTVFTKPVNNSQFCEIIVPDSINFGHPIAVALIVLDSIFIILTVVCLVFYIKHRRNRLIKATSRELSTVIWTGAFLSYISVFFFFISLKNGCQSSENCDPSPQASTCYAQFIFFNLAFTIIYAPILVRANRIHRIFSGAKRGAERPKFIENKFQLLFTAVLIAMQILIILICCIVSEYGYDTSLIIVKNSLDLVQLDKSYMACIFPYTLLLPPVLYNLLLVLACAFHAFKTRKLPDNFNESRFIGLTVYTTLILWLAFIPTYLTITNDYFKGLPLVGALMINSLLTISCMFVPKLFALRWVSREKLNVRSQSVMSSGDANVARYERRSTMPQHLPLPDADKARVYINPHTRKETDMISPEGDSGYVNSSPESQASTDQLTV